MNYSLFELLNNSQADGADTFSCRSVDPNIQWIFLTNNFNNFTWHKSHLTVDDHWKCNLQWHSMTHNLNFVVLKISKLWLTCATNGISVSLNILWDILPKLYIQSVPKFVPPCNKSWIHEWGTHAHNTMHFVTGHCRYKMTCTYHIQQSFTSNRNNAFSWCGMQPVHTQFGIYVGFLWQALVKGNQHGALGMETKEWCHMKPLFSLAVQYRRKIYLNYSLSIRIKQGAHTTTICLKERICEV